MQQPYKRFAGYWLFATVVPLLAVAVVNVLEDPSGAFLSLHLKSFGPLRYLNRHRLAQLS